ncbi:uncharacterized protein LY79DRAFT_690880 [Colletotrichum navitas]|uniref:Carboxylesterase type B domain-containing protein n=1 Tax=Colletotrichum navitas TaxID=681940 RepID=A0AAD8PUE7_9PEZI|nr:uncharacterized protein LY79DRAFT_690880 [Colletotrichum navitas]KAK1584912.1 hypothetical protein LY79DRAFT_690880 [Colletotrichum navitas]
MLGAGAFPPDTSSRTVSISGSMSLPSPGSFATITCLRSAGWQRFQLLFDVPPGYHGNDVPYTCFNNETSWAGSPLNASFAHTLQAYLANFVKTGSPNGIGLTDVPLYGAEKTVLSLYNRTQAVDTTASE